MTRQEYNQWESFVGKSYKVDDLLLSVNTLDYPKYTQAVFDGKPKDQFEMKDAQLKWLLNYRSNMTY